MTAPDEIVEKHYVDSVLPLILYNVPRGTSVIDVGSGAGFPGVIMKMFRPDLEVTLLDSARKRTDYLSALTAHIGVECRVVTGRCEELSRSPDFREGYGVATARAVANLSALCEYCLPFVKVGGVFVAMKGEKSEAEIGKSEAACAALGGEVRDVIEYRLPSGDGRCLVVIEKVKATPEAFPRQRVNIVKNPIGS
ncbi:MAG: 16S rRNA (guanine(527)-N(7))-methyltransferase RsmG [Oscillospiraceae bacterium]|nr:16S rRNA (guanine(527)-N(7))-methyltransferase RsmG [Oscillospiraceae bacterium]